MLLLFLACGLGRDTAPDETDTEPPDTDSAPVDPCAGAPADDRCCRTTWPSLSASVCVEGGLAIQAVGTLEGWGTTDVRFVADDGTSRTVYVTPGLGLPDLGAVGRLYVEAIGACESMDGGSGWTWIAAEGTPDAPLVFAGTRGASRGEWSVVSVLEDESCPGHDASCCYETCREHPLRFVRADRSWELWAGEELTEDGFVARVHRATLGEGASDCDDGPGSDQIRWSVLPAP